MSERKGVQGRSRFREAKLKTVVETGNGFNRLGLPLSVLPQQAAKDYSRLLSLFVIRCRGPLPTNDFALPVMYEERGGEIRLSVN